MKVTRLFKDFFESEIVGKNGFNRCMTKTEIRAAGNSTYKKLAVQWLNEAFPLRRDRSCPALRDFVVADSLVLRNRQLLVAANRWQQAAK